MENLKHLKLVLTDEQWQQLIDFYPAKIKESERDQIILIAYWLGAEYGVVHIKKAPW